jgi:hypothetical protein
VDPQARINALKQYMDLYRQTAGREMNSYPHGNGFQPTRFNVDGMALDFAQRQLDQPENAPDFFGGEGPAYVAPQRVQSIASSAGFPLAPQDRDPVTRRPESTMSGMAGNFLRNLFIRR